MCMSHRDVRRLTMTSLGAAPGSSSIAQVCCHGPVAKYFLLSHTATLTHTRYKVASIAKQLRFNIEVPTL